MITRIEIDGFKSFVDFELDMPPLLVLVGANYGGKSNLLQAIDLYADLSVGGAGYAFGQNARSTAIFHRAVTGEQVDQCSISLSTGGPPGKAVLRREKFTVRSDGHLLPIREVVRVLEFVPAVMRQGAERGQAGALARDGRNIAAVVAALAGARPKPFGELLMDLAAVLPGLCGLEPVYDERREVWDLDFLFSTGRRLPSNMVSDGTLRVLGILTALHSSAVDQTLLIDEIEVGLHPAFLTALLGRIERRLEDEPSRQVITTTHSPVVVSQVLATRLNSVVFVDQVYGGKVPAAGGEVVTERTRARRVAADGERGRIVTPREVRRYLETVQPVDIV